MQTLKIEVDIADISYTDANKLGEYISDYLAKHYNVTDFYYSVKDGETNDGR